MDKLGLAVIGLHMGYGHLMNCQTHPRATLAAVCDLDEELLAETVASGQPVKVRSEF